MGKYIGCEIMRRAMRRGCAGSVLPPLTLRRGSAVLFAVLVCAAASAGGVTVEWKDSTRVRIMFPLTDGAGMGGNYAVCVTPVLTGGQGDSLRLHPVMFRGKANRRYMERGRLYGTEPPASARELAAGDTVCYEAVVSRKDAPWLWQGRVEVGALREKDGCCEVEPLPARAIGHLVYVPPFVPVFSAVEDNTGKAGELQRDNPVLEHISKYRPYDSTRILRKEKGALYVHFPLDKSALSRDFRGNAATLDRIVDITRAVMADSTSSVRVIQIVGLASVEGPQRLNRRLAGERARVLKDYVQRLVPTPDSLYEVVNGGEAWTELRDQIADSRSPWRDRLLAVIDTEKDADRRERLIRQLDGGRAYAWLKSDVLADQRNSGYLRIYYDYVPDTAARTINAASGLMGQGRYDEALRMLLTVRDDSRAQNALGVAYYMTGRRGESLGCFRRAAAGGNAQAVENLRQCETIEKAMRLKE